MHAGRRGNKITGFEMPLFSISNPIQNEVSIVISKYSNEKNYYGLRRFFQMVSHVSFIDLGKLSKRNSPDYLNNQVVFLSINFGLVSEYCYFCNKCKEDPLSL